MMHMIFGPMGSGKSRYILDMLLDPAISVDNTYGLRWDKDWPADREVGYFIEPVGQIDYTRNGARSLGGRLVAIDCSIKSPSAILDNIFSFFQNLNEERLCIHFQDILILAGLLLESGVYREEAIPMFVRLYDFCLTWLEQEAHAGTLLLFPQNAVSFKNEPTIPAIAFASRQYLAHPNCTSILFSRKCEVEDCTREGFPSLQIVLEPGKLVHYLKSDYKSICTDHIQTQKFIDHRTKTDIRRSKDIYGQLDEMLTTKAISHYNIYECHYNLPNFKLMFSDGMPQKRRIELICYGVHRARYMRLNYIILTPGNDKFFSDLPESSIATELCPLTDTSMATLFHCEACKYLRTCDLEAMADMLGIAIV